MRTRWSIGGAAIIVLMTWGLLRRSQFLAARTSSEPTSPSALAVTVRTTSSTIEDQRVREVQLQRAASTLSSTDSGQRGRAAAPHAATRVTDVARPPNPAASSVTDVEDRDAFALEPRDAVSPVSHVPAQLMIWNNCESDVELQWVKFDGNERHYQTIPSGRRYSQSTYAHHIWVLRRGNVELRRFSMAHDGDIVACPEASLDSIRERGGFCSGPHGDAVVMRIQNPCAHPTRAFWVDGACELHPYVQVAPHDAATQRTFINHVWELNGSRVTAQPVVTVPCSDS